MKQRAKKLFGSNKQLKRRVLSSFLLGDGVYCFFLLEFLKPQNLSSYLVKNQWMLSSLKKTSGHQINQDDLFLLAQIMSNSIVFMIIILICSNIFFYWFFYKNKNWATKYLKGQGILGFIFGILFFWEGYALGWYWAVALLLTAPLYLYGALGIHHQLKFSNNKV